MAGSNSGFKVISVVVLLLLAVGIFIKTRSSAQGPGDGTAYFYDLTSGELFPASSTLRPPIDAPGGANKGVRAFVYACGECSPTTQKVGYLISITPEARAMMDKPLEDADPAVLQRGQVIAITPEKVGDEVQWVVRTSPDGARVSRIPSDTCAGARPVECFPGR